MADGPSDAQLEAFLGSGHERPVIHAMRAQRVALGLAALVLLAWLATLALDALRPYEEAARVAWMLALSLALLLRPVIRHLDRRAMKKDLALLEETDGRR